MRYVAAYLLAVLGGNQNPSKGDIEKILSAVGLEIDDDKIDKVISELNGKDIQQVMSEGMSKLASIPSGGVVTAGASGGGDTKEEAKEEKKEEIVESEEESDDDMGFGLFDD